MAVRPGAADGRLHRAAPSTAYLDLSGRRPRARSTPPARLPRPRRHPARHALARHVRLRASSSTTSTCPRPRAPPAPPTSAASPTSSWTSPDSPPRKARPDAALACFSRRTMPGQEVSTGRLLGGLRPQADGSGRRAVGDAAESARRGTSMGSMAGAAVGARRPDADRPGGPCRADSGAGARAVAGGRSRTAGTCPRRWTALGRAAHPRAGGARCRPPVESRRGRACAGEGRRSSTAWPTADAPCCRFPCCRAAWATSARSAGVGQPRAVRAVRTRGRGRAGMLHGDPSRVRRDPALRAACVARW